MLHASLLSWVAALIVLAVLLAGCARTPEYELSAPPAGHSAAPGVSAPVAASPPALDDLPETPHAVAHLSAWRLHQDAEGKFWIGVNTEVYFDAGASQGTQRSYRWEFGDGANATTWSASHYYTVLGDYALRLEVRDGMGRRDATEIALGVRERPWGAPPPVEVSGVIGVGNPLSGVVTGVTELDCGRTPQLQGLDGYIFGLNESYAGGWFTTWIVSGATGLEKFNVWYYTSECTLAAPYGLRSGPIPARVAWAVVNLEKGAALEFGYLGHARA